MDGYVGLKLAILSIFSIFAYEKYTAVSYTDEKIWSSCCIYLMLITHTKQHPPLLTRSCQISFPRIYLAMERIYPKDTASFFSHFDCTQGSIKETIKLRAKLKAKFLFH